MSQGLTPRFSGRRFYLIQGAAMALSWAGWSGVQAQTLNGWPTKAVKLLVAYPPGGVSDVVARALADRLAQRWSVPVVVENKAGASGALGVNAVVKSPPDGYTLAFSAISPLTLSPHLGKSLFDPLKDIAPVSGVMVSPVLLLATPAAGFSDFKGLLAWAKAKPGAVRWATSGPASLGHVMLEQLHAATRLEFTHIPYKGGGQQITDALGGQFEVLSVNTSAAVLQHIKEGKLRVLAVGAPARLDSLPETPTLAELGYRAANLSSQFAVLAPAGTPVAMVERLNADIQAVLSQPAMRERLNAAECLPLKTSVADLTRTMGQEYENMGRIVKEARIVGE
jgi:tripartite-type tricarboxylate transporter receptor subunit TctC